MEKRNFGRLSKRLFLKFGRSTPENIGFSGDISSTGIFIKTTYVLEPGTHVIIDLTLPDNRIIRLEGSVMWAKRIPPNLVRYIKKSGMGVLLDHATNEYTQLIKSLS